MTTPNPRTKILLARGAYADLLASLADIAEGEMVFATDQSQFYVKYGGVFVATSVTSVNSQTGDVVLDADDISDAATTNKFTTAADISKLAGIEAGAQVNTVDSVAGKTGDVVLVKADITDFSDADYATATQGALADTALQPGDALEFAPSSAAAPGLFPTGDGDTGIYSPGADQVAISTAGTERFAIDSTDGNPIIDNQFPTVRPSLDLNFAGTRRLDSRVTFSRSSTAAYYDATGTLQSAATNEARFDHDPTTGESLGLLVEEARTNLVTYSEQFDNAAWTPLNLSVTPNAITAPDGTLTAGKLVENSLNVAHLVDSAVFSVSSGVKYTCAVYVKAAERTAILLQNQSFAGGGYAVFDLATGTVSLTGASGIGTIQSVGNGWYRCSVTTTAIGTGGAYLRVYMVDSPTSSSGYQGDGVSGLYVWGAQFEAGSFPTSYIPTPSTFTSRSTTATYYDANGTIQTAGINVARDNAYLPDENGVFKPVGLLLEGAGTNYALNSSTLNETVWWNYNYNVVRTFNAGVAPDGTTTATLLTVNSNLQQHFLSGNPPAVPSAIYTHSVYVKQGTGSYRVRVSINSAPTARVDFNFSTEQVYNVYGGTASSKKLPGGWYRISITASSATTFSQAYVFMLDATGSDYYTGDGTSSFYVWGYQVEASPYPTSYIPTTSSTVTRAADVSSSSAVTRAADAAQITGANFSSWYNQSAGTIYSETKNIPFGGGLWYFGPGNSPRWWSRYEITNGIRTEAYDGVEGSDVVNIGVPGVTNNSTIPTLKHCVAINNVAQEHVGSANGSTVVTGVWDSITGVTQLNLGIRSDNASYLNGHISRLTYYPVRLPDATLQTITL